MSKNTRYLQSFMPLFIAIVVVACGGGGGGSSSSEVESSPVTNEFTVSGTITAAVGSVADNDVNDPNAPYTSNDDIDTAQSISNPAMVGGYVNTPGSGSEGRSRSGGDVSDIYRVTLVENQIITLTVGDTELGDLDLFLGDEEGNLLDSSEGTGVTETLTVLEAGTYLVQVWAYDGASNYSLSIGQGINPATVRSLSVQAEFIPGELLARFEPGKAGTQTLGSRLSSMGMQTAASDLDATTGPVLIKLNDTSATAAAASDTASAGMPLGIAGNVQLEHKWRTLCAVKQLRKQPEVRYAELNYLRKTFAVPTDEYYNLQWHYPLINLPQAWDVTTGDNGVIVAVIDTGVLIAHPDLRGQLVTGYDFIRSPDLSADGDGLDPNPNDPGDKKPGQAVSSFHGTHVAGTIAARTNNATGVAGIAWNSRIMPLRVLGVGGRGNSYDINQAILYAAGLPNDSGILPAQRADIINLSLGGVNFSQADQDVITQARNQGVIVIAAAGNEAEEGNPIEYPASYNGVVSVGAVTLLKQRAPYSCFNTFVDIAAPGGDLYQDINGDGWPDGVLSTVGVDNVGMVQHDYTFYHGTSMAAPHVAGVAALMKSVNPGLTPAEFDELLVSGKLTLDLGEPGRDSEFGYGLVDAFTAIEAVQGAPTPVPATLVVTPNGLNFGTKSTNATLSLVNGGGSQLTVTSVLDNASWLTVGAASDPGTGLGIRTVAVDRSGLAEGTYSAKITLVSTENTVTISVIMEVGTEVVSSDAGFLYVVLFDPATGENRYETQLSARNGLYQYSISNVQAGSYTLSAGTDNNNDFYICDKAESCGNYPNSDSDTLLEVSGDVSGVDFDVGLNTVLRDQSAKSSSDGIRRLSGRRVGP